MELFKPAWQSKNIDKALDAVNKVNTQTQLFNIVMASEEQFSWYRRSRGKKIFYSNSAQVKMRAIERMTDQSLLADISQNSSVHEDLRIAAIGKLSDPALAEKLCLEIAEEMKRYKESSTIVALFESHIKNKKIIAGVKKYLHDADKRKRDEYNRIRCSRGDHLWKNTSDSGKQRCSICGAIRNIDLNEVWEMATGIGRTGW
jgi:hypothetical protein